MSYVLVGFSHDRSDWISRLMAWLTFGTFSHLVIIDPEGRYFIEATGMKKPDGVQPPRPIYEFLEKPNAVLRIIPHSDPDAVWHYALSQVGKRYDWSWLWGWLFRRRDWQTDDRWVCSELFAWACVKAGHAIFPEDHLWHISPNDIYMVSEPLV